MNYQKKLRLAKTLVSLGLAILMLAPLMEGFGVGHIGSSEWTPHARFHVAATSFGNILA